MLPYSSSLVLKFIDHSKCIRCDNFVISGSGDGEGGTEMTESMQLIREFCDRLVTPEKAARTRIVWTFLYKFMKSSPLRNWSLFFLSCANHAKHLWTYQLSNNVQISQTRPKYLILEMLKYM